MATCSARGTRILQVTLVLGLWELRLRGTQRPFVGWCRIASAFLGCVRSAGGRRNMVVQTTIKEFRSVGGGISLMLRIPCSALFTLLLALYDL